MKKKVFKPTLCLDFDGVIHSYTSGWKGARRIPDPPVDGALSFIVEALDHFEVCIFSSRSHQWLGKYAMKMWLYNHLVELSAEHSTEPRWWTDHVMAYASTTLEPWHLCVHEVARDVVKRIKWPVHKPAALLTIDARAMTFAGKWPSIPSIKGFKPWKVQS